MKKNYFIVGVLLLITVLLVTGCSWKEENVSFPNSENKQHEISTENMTSIVWDDSKECVIPVEVCGEKNLFYVVEFDLYNDSTQNNVSVKITPDKDTDFNAEQIKATEVAPRERIRIQQVIKTDNNGNANVEIKMKAPAVLKEGQVYISDVLITPIDEHMEYVLLQSDNGKVICVFLKEDIEKYEMSIQKLEDILEELSVLRDKLQYISGDYQPFDDVSRFVFTESMNFSGLAGNPIYINREDLDILLSECCNAKKEDTLTRNSLMFLLCHEMSHTFDFSDETNNECGYTFDREFFANIKAIYALKECGYSLEENFFVTSPGLKDGVYNQQDFSAHFTEILCVDRNMECLRTVLSRMRDNNIDAPKNEKFRLFEEYLFEYGNIKMEDFFEKIERETLQRFFDTMV